MYRRVLLSSLAMCAAGFFVTGLLAPAEAFAAGDAQSPKGKKVLWIDSYHKGYGWSDGTEAGLRKGLEGSHVVLDVVRMDTKRQDSPKSMQAAGAKVLEKVNAFNPDVIIASDDAAQQFAVLPHLLDKNIPIVFTGVNWDASMYGYPRKNVTGMVEVEPIATLVQHLRNLGGTRIAFIAGDDLSEKKTLAYFEKQNDIFPKGFDAAMVHTYEAFQKEFLRLQEKNDVIIFTNTTTIQGWDAVKSPAWTLQNTRVLTGSCLEFVADFVLIAVTKMASEQGEFGAQATLRILQGTATTEIPVVTNQKSALLLNRPLAEKQGIVFPLSLLRAAKAPPKN